MSENLIFFAWLSLKIIARMKQKERAAICRTTEIVAFGIVRNPSARGPIAMRRYSPFWRQSAGSLFLINVASTVAR